MPSTLLDARRITRHHGARTLLDAVDLRVDAGSRIALIGPNGSGTSTFAARPAITRARLSIPSARARIHSFVFLSLSRGATVARRTLAFARRRTSRSARTRCARCATACSCASSARRRAASRSRR